MGWKVKGTKIHEQSIIHLQPEGGPAVGGGLMLPRLTTTQRDAMSSPADGILIYNSTTSKAQIRAAGAWVDLH